MRIRPSILSSPRSTSLAQRGSVLVTTLVLCSILGLTLAGYLYWVRTQNILVAQSQAWNVSLAYAEAGIEEGMAQINVYFHTNYLPSAAANWGGGPLTGHFGPRTHNFTDGSYSAIIVPEAGAPGPTIISTGYSFVPILGKRVTRVVKVTTVAVCPFGNAITVRSNLTAKGTGLTIDSFDSGDPGHCTTNGMYDPATRKAGGDVNSTGGLIDVQNAEIYGHLNVGPEGTFVIGQGSVGPLDWNVPGEIKEGWYANDFNMDIKQVQPPYLSGAEIVAVDNKTNRIYELGSNKYFLNNKFVLSQNEAIVVTGNAEFYVTGDFTMKSQNDCAIIISNNCSLKLFVGSEVGTNTALLTQVNTLGNAYTFQFYGLPSLKTMSWGGNNTYVGTIFAPEADFTLGGGGADPKLGEATDYQGAMVAKSAVLNGHFNIHYDENLRKIVLPDGFDVVSWQELPPSETSVASSTPPSTSTPTTTPLTSAVQ